MGWIDSAGGGGKISTIFFGFWFWVVRQIKSDGLGSGLGLLWGFFVLCAYVVFYLLRYSYGGRGAEMPP